MPRSTKFSFHVPGTPQQVSKQLKTKTRLRLTPSQAKAFGSEEKPLGGMVGADRFRVGLNRNDLMTPTQAVARGTLEASGGGTRVEGVAGIPPAIVWLLRLGFIVAVTMGVGTGIGAGLEGLTPAVLMSGLFSLVVAACALGIGWNVNHAVGQIDELVATLQRTVTVGGDAVGEVEVESAAETEDEAARLQQAAATRKPHT